MKSKLNKLLANFEQKSKKLEPIEKYSIRLGWFAAALIMIAPHLLHSAPTAGYIVYIVGGILGTPQVLVSKQWNLVLLNVNVTVAYLILYLS